MMLRFNADRLIARLPDATAESPLDNRAPRAWSAFCHCGSLAKIGARERLMLVGEDAASGNFERGSREREVPLIKANQLSPASAANSDPGRALVVILAAMVAQQVLLNLWSLLSYKDIIYVPRFWPGFDILDFFRASRDFLAGLPPYAAKQFVTPPLSVFIAMPFLPLGWPASIYAFFIVNLAMVATAIALVARRFSIYSVREIALLAGIFGLYYLAYFLLERGNIDGVAMVCVGLVIWAAGRSVAAPFVVLGVDQDLPSSACRLVRCRAPMAVAMDWSRDGSSICCRSLVFVARLRPSHRAPQHLLWRGRKRQSVQLRGPTGAYLSPVQNGRDYPGNCDDCRFLGSPRRLRLA
jgi:hypothetical protein